jgi:hypothetical protein
MSDEPNMTIPSAVGKTGQWIGISVILLTVMYLVFDNEAARDEQHASQMASCIAIEAERVRQSP